MSKYRPQFISLKEVFSDVLSAFPSGSLFNECSIIEAIKLQDFPGYFLTYNDFIKLLDKFDSDAVKYNPFSKIIEQVGFLPISHLALKKLQDLLPEILSQVDVERIIVDCEKIEELFYKPTGLSCLLQLFARQDEDLQKSNAFCLYPQEGSFKIYLRAVEEITKSVQTEEIDTFYYDIQSDEMVKLSQAFWSSKNREILWKQGTIFIKGKYQECFIEKNGAKKIISLDNSFDTGAQDITHKKGILEFNYLNDFELMNADINVDNLKNIKDSLSFRVFKLALICDALDYRKATTETLADFIYHTQDWYFEGTQKTMSLAKKAASMIRSLEAAKGGTAYDTRRFNPKTGLIK